MNHRFDVAVVGSGIVGLGAALAARRRGRSVVVVDRAAAVTGASVRNFGHVCTTAQDGEARELALRTRELWRGVAHDAGIRLRECGTVVAARHPDELALLEAIADLRAGSPMGERPEVELLDAGGVRRLADVRDDLVGGAHLPYDLQVDPRAAAPALARRLAALGVEFRLRTAALGAADGVLTTTRGPILADSIVVAVNHDLDQLLPELAERHRVERCALDMLRVEFDRRVALTAPLFTGWSLIRYRGFAGLPESAAVRERLHGDRPDLAAVDLNQMYTRFDDGSIVVGDSHARSAAPSPFQSEHVAELMLDEAQRLFGAVPRVVERWQGVYATAPDEFLVEDLDPTVVVTTVTTGIGMTTGLGLADRTIAARYDSVPIRQEAN